jgi:hypothetical protein
MTGLTLKTDKSEYSRHESARSIVKVRLLPTPAAGLAETVTIALRRKGGPVVSTQEITLTGDYPKGHVVSFDLPEIKDASGIPLCIRGEYQVEASAGDVTASTDVFRIALITVEEMRNGYCFGVPLYASDTPFPKRQPSAVTGVTFSRLSESTRKMVYALVYTAATDSNPATLAWGGGPAIPITGASEILLDPRGGYAEVNIDEFELPVEDASEGIVVDKQYWDDDKIRSQIDKAISEVENVLLKVYIEPYRVATEPYYSEPDAFYDLKAVPVMYTSRDFNFNALAWKLDLPFHQLLRVDKMSGHIGNSSALEISSGAFAVNKKSGTVDILPYNGQYSYMYTFFQQINFWGYREYIADFWRYIAVAGLPETPADILKLVGYKAAVSILTIAGHAYRGGFSSESTSKDGVSRSVSYTASASYGIYSATIENNEKWIKENAPKLRTQYRGLSMVTL